MTDKDKEEDNSSDDEPLDTNAEKKEENKKETKKGAKKGKGKDKKEEKKEDDKKEDKKEDKKKNDKAEAKESDSDEEPPVGMLDQPIEIIYTKRAAKVVERLQAPETLKPKSTGVKVPEGRGKKLGEHPQVVKNLAKEDIEDCKVIFGVLFGNKRVKAKLVKKTIKLWCGWDVVHDTPEHHKYEENAANLTTKNLEWCMKVLDIDMDQRGKRNKENMMEILSDWALDPQPREKKENEPKKKKGKKAPKKSVPKKAAPKGKKEKAPADKPKRPMSAYFLWLGENRASLVEELGTKDIGTIGKAAGEKWKELDDDDKKEFQEKSEKAKEKYEKDMKAWLKKNPDQTPEALKKAKKEAKKAEKENDKKKDAKKGAKKEDKKPDKKTKIKIPAKRKADTKDDAKKGGKKKKLTLPSDKDLVTKIKDILDGADLETVTMKQVVQKVFDSYPGVDLLPKKTFIKSKVKEIIA